VPFRIAQIAAFSLLFCAVSLTGILLTPSAGSNLLILRGSGVAIAILLIVGRELWPAIFIGSLLNRIILIQLGYWDFSTAFDVAETLVLAITMTAQGLLGKTLIREFCGYPIRLRGWRHLASVMFIAIPASCIPVSSVGIAFHVFATRITPDDVGFYWLVWWLGDVIAINLAVMAAVLGPWLGPTNAFWRGAPIPRFTTPALLYVTLSVAVSLGAWSYVARLGNEAQRSQFNAAQHDSEQALRHRLSVIELAVNSGVGLFRASGLVTAPEWNRYVKTLNLSDANFGIRSMGFIEPVDRADLDTFLDDARREGVLGLEVTPKAKDGPMFIIKYLENLESGKSALGLDISFEKERYRAAISARDTGKIALTPPIDLIPVHNQGKGFLMLAPVYAGLAQQPETVEARRASFIGWAYATFNASSVLSDLTIGQDDDLVITAYHGDATTPDAAFYVSEAQETSNRRAQYRITETFEAYGEAWTIVWESTAALEDRLWTMKPAIVLIGGVSFSILLAVFLISLAQREELVRGIVVQRTRELATQVDENRSIIETAVATIALLDGRGNLLRYNDAFARLLVNDGVNAVGSHLSTLLNGQINDYFIHAADADVPSPYRGEVRTLSILGKPLILDVQIIPWKNSDGERRFTAVMRDTSRYHAAAEQLRSTQRRLELALNAGKIGVFDFNLRTQHAIVSRTWCELMGVEFDAFADPQSQWLDRVHPDDMAHIRAADEACIEGRSARSVSEYRVRAAGGVWRWMRSEMTGEERDENGRAWRMIGLMTDITDQHQVDELKNQFVATVSHELRTPLTSINGSISLLLNAMSDGIPETAKRMLQIAQKNCDRLILLVNDILDLEKLESGQEKPELTLADIGAQVERAVQVNQPYAAQFDVTYTINGDLPSANVLIEENRFQQVMTNLLSNSAKFSPVGGVVSVEVVQEGEQIVIRVTDNGEGIPPQFHDKIFKPFSQVDSTSIRKREGTGLGLHIAKRTIDQMGGEIGFDSEPGVKTTFWIKVPLQSGTVPAPADPDLAPDTSDLETLRILHVEADHDVAEVLAAAFAPSAELVHAHNDEAARYMLSLEPYAMVILGRDTGRPAEQALLDQIITLQPNAKIVALTSNEGPRPDPRLVVHFTKSKIQLEDVAKQCLEIIWKNKDT
jgi:signal transduction histidine kinase/CHASE1-domain containing sensor protein